MTGVSLDAIPSISIVETLLIIVPAAVTFLVFYFYWDLDQKTEKFDERCREDIRSEEAFHTIRKSADIEYIITSDTRRSKAKSALQKLSNSRSNKPYKIVPVESQSKEERKKEIILERCREIPGKNIIQPELLGAIRNYHAYKLALSQEGVDSNVTQHFHSKFQEYELSGRIADLTDTDHYENICLFGNPGENKRPLRLFLRILEEVENECLVNSNNLDKHEKEINECRRRMMFLFYGMWSGDMKGAILTKDIGREIYTTKFREDIRENDNVGYWLAADFDGLNIDIGRFNNVAWKIDNILDEYWDEDNYTKLHPNADSIPQIEQVSYPFILFQKELEEFNGGPTHERIKGKAKYRKKAEYRG